MLPAYPTFLVCMFFIAFQQPALAQSGRNDPILPNRNHDLQNLLNVTLEHNPKLVDCSLAVCVDADCAPFSGIPNALSEAQDVLGHMMPELNVLLKLHQKAHVESLQRSRKTGERYANLQDVVAVQQSLTDFSGWIWDIANSVEFITEFATDTEKFEDALDRLVHNNPDSLAGSLTKILKYQRKLIGQALRMQKRIVDLPPELAAHIAEINKWSGREKSVSNLLKEYKKHKLGEKNKLITAMAKPLYREMKEINKLALATRKILLKSFENDLVSEHEMIKASAGYIRRIILRIEKLNEVARRLSRMKSSVKACNDRHLKCKPPRTVARKFAPDGLTPGERLGQLKSRIEDLSREIDNAFQLAKFDIDALNSPADLFGVALGAIPRRAFAGESITLTYSLTTCMAKHGQFNKAALVGAPAGRRGTVSFTMPGGATDGHQVIFMTDRRTGNRYVVPAPAIVERKIKGVMPFQVEPRPLHPYKPRTN